MRDDLFPPGPGSGGQAESDGEVSTATWRTLHEAAAAVRRAEPWQLLSDQDLFGVADPATEEVCPVTVLGQARVVYGVQIYLPPEGVAFWHEVFEHGEPSRHTGTFAMRMIEAEFVNKQDLEAPDLKVRAALGLETPKARGHAWPLFRSWRPRCAPWYLDENEARRLELARRRALDFQAAVQANPVLSDNVRERLPVFRLQTGADPAQSGAWTLGHEPFPAVERGRAGPAPDDAPVVAIFPRTLDLRVRKGQVWEAGAFFLPAPVMAGSRLVYPTAALIAETASGTIAGIDLDADPSSPPEVTLAKVALATCRQAGFLPAAFHVLTPQAAKALEPLAEHGVQIIRKIQLPAFSAAAAGLMGHLGGAKDLVTPHVAADPGHFPEDSGGKATPGKRKAAAKGVTKESAPKLYQLKITLRGSDPAIWRSVVVPVDIALEKLHEVFQVVMGWENCHMHLFRCKDRTYGEPNPDDDALLDEADYTLADLAPRARSRFIYEYDLGDGWEHEVVVEKVLPPGSEAELRCLAGERACPPEDSGGIWGFHDLLEAVADPAAEDHEHYKEWLGDYDPAQFDLARLNKALRKLRLG